MQSIVFIYQNINLFRFTMFEMYIILLYEQMDLVLRSIVLVLFVIIQLISTAKLLQYE